MPRVLPPDYHGPYLDLDYEPFDDAEVSAIVAHVAFPLTASFDEARLRIELCRLAQLHQVLVRSASSPSAASDYAFLVDLERAASRLTEMIPLNETPDGALAAEFHPEPSFGVWKLLDVSLHVEMQAQLEQERAASLKADRARLNLANSNDPSVRRRPPRIDPSITADVLFGSAYGKEVLILANRINGLIAAAAGTALAGMEPVGRTEAPGTNERTCMSLMKLYREAFGRPIAFSSADNVVGGPMVRFVSKCCDTLGISLEPGSIAKIKQKHFPAKTSDPT